MTTEKFINQHNERMMERFKAALADGKGVDLPPIEMARRAMDKILFEEIEKEQEKILLDDPMMYFHPDLPVMVKDELTCNDEAMRALFDIYALELCRSIRAKKSAKKTMEKLHEVEA